MPCEGGVGGSEGEGREENQVSQPEGPKVLR